MADERISGLVELWFDTSGNIQRAANGVDRKSGKDCARYLQREHSGQFVSQQPQLYPDQYLREQFESRQKLQVHGNIHSHGDWKTARNVVGLHFRSGDVASADFIVGNRDPVRFIMKTLWGRLPTPHSLKFADTLTVWIARLNSSFAARRWAFADSACPPCCSCRLPGLLLRDEGCACRCAGVTWLLPAFMERQSR